MNYPDLEKIKKQAKILTNFLNHKEKIIKLSNAYEAISLMWGFKNWNTFNAFLKNLEETKNEPS